MPAFPPGEGRGPTLSASCPGRGRAGSRGASPCPHTRLCPPAALQEKENILTYKRHNIEHVLEMEAKQHKPPKVVSPQEMLQSFLKNNIQVGEECGKLLLERGTTKMAEGLVLNRDRRLGLPENNFEVISKEQLEYFCKKIQARILIVKASQGLSYFRLLRKGENPKSMETVLNVLKSTLQERYKFVEVTGNHYVHMQEPHKVAELISDFLESNQDLQSHL